MIGIFWACCPHYPPKTVKCESDAKIQKGLLSTLSPKNWRKWKGIILHHTACCPHYPPKTMTGELISETIRLACCPHYPPKTSLIAFTSTFMFSPAVHTIPQKLEVFYQKNLPPDAACCPHYPPKTDYFP